MDGPPIRIRLRESDCWLDGIIALSAPSVVITFGPGVTLSCSGIMQRSKNRKGSDGFMSTIA